MNIWRPQTPGIPDDLFVKGDSPITKAEVRALVLAKLQLQAQHILWDVGSGTGSVAIEASRFVPHGRVYAVETLPQRVAVIQENIRRFECENIHVIQGTAPEIFVELPAADRIFIGGSGGNLPEILQQAAVHLQPGGRLVMTAVAVESLYSALDVLSRLPYTGLEGQALQISHLTDLKDYHLFKPEHTVYVLTATRTKEQA